MRQSDRSGAGAQDACRARRVIALAVAAVILTGSVGVAYWAITRGRSAETERGPRLNVLLLMVDTLRADRLGCYGSKLGATPCLDALAATSTRFEHAYAHAPWTLPSFGSLLTSLTPPGHRAGGHVGQFLPLAPGVRTVADCFRAAGYVTGSVVNVDFLGADFGLTRGFSDVNSEAYPNNIQVRRAARTTDAAVRWLSAHRLQPFFLMVHYFDPHLVYDPPPEFRRKYADPQDQTNAKWVFGTRQQIVAYRQGLTTFDAPTLGRAEKLYNGEVAYTDHEIGRLLASLARLQLQDSTIIVLGADHGEEFLDHGGFEHGHSLYNELVHVPLVVHVPGRPGPQVARSAVGLIDVAPTLCALTGVAPDPAFVGRSLVGAIEGKQLAERPILMEGNFWGPALRGWLQGGYKLIVEPRGNHLFDLSLDPDERRDLAALEPQRAQAMLEDMKLALEATQRGDVAQAVKLSPQQLARLRSLGYVD